MSEAASRTVSRRSRAATAPALATRSRASKTPQRPPSPVALQSGARLRLAPTLQPQLEVNQPNDSFEREANGVADRVMRMAAPATTEQPPAASPPLQRMDEEETDVALAQNPRQIQRMAAPDDKAVQRAPQHKETVQRASQTEETVQRAPQAEEKVQRAAQTEETVQRASQAEETVQRVGDGGRPAVSARTAATIRSPGSGQALAPGIRRRIEPQVGADLSTVRVHSGPAARRAASSVRAHAFTHRNHIFLQHPGGAHNLRLMAHEATHVVQQGAAPVQRMPAAAEEVQRMGAPEVQRLPLGLGDFLNDYARQIPGYLLFTVIIGFNPLTGEGVDRNAINLLQGLMGLVPFGTAIFDKLQEHGIVQAAFDWVQGELDRLDLSVARIERTLEAAWEDVRVSEGFDYNLAVLERHFGQLYNDVVAFALSLVNHIIELIKGAVLDVVEGLLAENKAWALIKKILHYDPLRSQPVEASTVEILADFLLLIGKEQELAQMRERGTLETTAAWLDTQLGTFMALLSQLGALFSAAWDAIQPENLPDLATNLQTLAGQALDFLQGVWDFAVTVAATVLQLIKDALLGWLQSYAITIPGYHLVTVILGRDVFTQELVPPTPTNLIRGFMSLVPGGEQQFQQLSESGVVPAAAQRIEGLLGSLGISWAFVQALFLGIWNALTIEDLIDPVGAFQRIMAQFGEPIGRLFTFVIEVIKVVIELILQMMGFPFDLIGSIISNALQAIDDITRDPVGFLLNLLAAMKLGFSNFFGNILQHLLGGLTDWLFRGLRAAGVEPPTDLSLASILNFVLDILGISMERIWAKVAERIGQENVDRIRGAIDRLVGVWNFVKDVQERGVVAIWEYIESQISGLWNMVLAKAQEWIMERIINRAIQWLLSLLDPTGIMPVINSCLAFFHAVQSAIEYLRDILVIVNDYVSTVASIARGDIAPGAQKMEQGLANAIPVAIGFLANQFGLGNIGDKMTEIIGGVRELIDQALNWLLDQAMRLWAGMMRMLGMGGEGSEEAVPGAEPEGTIAVDKPFAMSGTPHTLSARITPNGAVNITMASLVPEPLIQALENSVTQVRDMGASAPDGLLSLLGLILSAARQDENEMRQNYNASGARSSIMMPGERTLSFETYVDRELTHLMLQLIDLANRHNLHNLTDYFAAVPEQRYLPIGYNVRNRLYLGPQSGWGATRSQVMRNGQNAIRQRIINAQRNNNEADFEEMKREDKYIYNRQEYQLATFNPDWVIDGTISYEVDHKISLAEHWQSHSGNTTNDQNRWNQATIGSNLEVVTDVYNNRKSSAIGDSNEFARYQPRWVSLTFTSHLAESNRNQAKTIEGQPFLHSDGGPPIQ